MVCTRYWLNEWWAAIYVLRNIVEYRKRLGGWYNRNLFTNHNSKHAKWQFKWNLAVCTVEEICRYRTTTKPTSIWIIAPHHLLHFPVKLLGPISILRLLFLTPLLQIVVITTRVVMFELCILYLRQHSLSALAKTRP